MSFQGKTALITGGASGMGLLCGQCLAREGANVALLDVNREGLDAAARGICQSGGDAIGLLTDIRVYAQVEQAVSKTVEAFGSVDILINCAGGASRRVLKRSESFENMPVEVLDWGIDVNLKGPLYCARAVFGQMMGQGGGVIVNLGSISGEEGSFSSPDYSAAKSGMNGLTKSLAQGGAKYNIRSVCVSPGPVLTRPGMAKMTTLLGRAADPQEIVDFILYLVSDKAAFVTGSSFLIDGGRHCMGH